MPVLVVRIWLYLPVRIKQAANGLTNERTPNEIKLKRSFSVRAPGDKSQQIGLTEIAVSP